MAQFVVRHTFPVPLDPTPFFSVLELAPFHCGKKFALLVAGPRTSPVPAALAQWQPFELLVAVSTCPVVCPPVRVQILPPGGFCANANPANDKSTRTDFFIFTSPP